MKRYNTYNNNCKIYKYKYKIMINKSSRVLLGAIDQSTTATKFTLFDQQGQQIAQAIKEH